MATSREAAADAAPGPGSYASVAALYAEAKALKEKEEEEKETAGRKGREPSVAERRNMVKAKEFSRAWAWSVGFFGWLL